MSAYDRNNRLRSIAINAVREARIAYGRDDRSWIDDDAARVENIYNTLFLTELESIDGNLEHFPLAPKSQPAINEAVRKVADILGNLPAVFEDEPTALKVAGKKS